MLATTVVLAGTPIEAADLPFSPEGRPAFRASRPTSLPTRAGAEALPTEQVLPGPRRFDVYGYPIRSPVFAAPEPLYASTGCPAALQPVYDSLGNFAGYAATQMCR